MSKASRSGRSVNRNDVPKILGMVARDDRRHDIAAWFGLNQGRIAEVEDGEHGTPPVAPSSQLPPSGSPGPKALSIRDAVRKAISALESGQESAAAVARNMKDAAAQFDQNE